MPESHFIPQPGYTSHLGESAAKLWQLHGSTKNVSPWMKNFPEINQVSLERGKKKNPSFSKSQHFSAPLTSHCSVVLEMKTATFFSSLLALEHNKMLSRQDAISSVCDKSRCDRLQLRLNIMLQASKRKPLSPHAPHYMQRRWKGSLAFQSLLHALMANRDNNVHHIWDTGLLPELVRMS